MKWRSMNEKPKIEGYYFVLIKTPMNGDRKYSTKYFDSSTWERGSYFEIIAWLDPEVPEEFLAEPKPEKKPCPFCGGTDWNIATNCQGFYSFRCPRAECAAYGPLRATYSEAEAAIFERVK